MREEVASNMDIIKKITEEHADYLKDESRSVGYADTISFPESESDVIAVLRELNGRTPVTVQGARTGLAAAAVPYGGHVMNMSRMNRVTALRRGKNGLFYITVQPGVILSQLRKDIEEKRFNTAGWSGGSLAALRELAESPEQFFPTDPTESSACIGGIAACNASGARSFKYKSARKHISALRLVLWDGRTASFKRGENFADGRKLTVEREDGTEIEVRLPTFEMPETKNASGYHAADGMDAIDLIIGSDGTLGVLTEIELELLPLPPVIWSVSSFFASESDAVEFVLKVRSEVGDIAAMEYFDRGALAVLKGQKETCATFAQLPDVDGSADCCVYIELHCGDEETALKRLYEIGDALEASGGSENDTWTARTAFDIEKLHLFRHAVPESTNMYIDERKKKDPEITKLGADMSVPDDKMREMFLLYRNGLAEKGLESAIWGHIGDNHLHVNILFRDRSEFDKGKELYAEWAAAVSEMGGAVSAEHGVGKIKAPMLEVMYGRGHVAEMARVKLAFDPHFIFGRGNLFSPDILEGGAAK